MFSVSAVIARTNEKGEQVYQIDPKEPVKCLRVKVTSEAKDTPHTFKLTEAICSAFRQPFFEKEYFRWLYLVSRCRQILPRPGSGDLLYILEDTEEPLKSFSALTETDIDLIDWIKEAPKRVDGETTNRKHGTYALFVNPPKDPFNLITEALYTSILHRAAPLASWKIYYPSKMEFPTPDEIKQFDGFVLTGSTANVDDPEYESWINPFMKTLDTALTTNQKAKFLGICFGHQIIAKTMGGEVHKREDGKFIMGVETIELTPEIKALPYFQKFITAEGKMQLNITEAHGRDVTKLPPKATLGGFSKNTAHEIYWVGDRVLCFQGHPEYSTEFIVYRQAYAEKLTREEAMEKFGKRVTGNESEKILAICMDYLFS